MASKKELPTISPKAKEAFKTLRILDHNDRRVQSLVNAGEYGFAILILWNRIEITLKLLKYYEELDGYPNKLNFINRNWRVLGNIHKGNPAYYDLIIKNMKSSLWKTRDRIAHASINISNVEYEGFKLAGDYFLFSISQNLQPLNKFIEKKSRKRQN